MLRQVLQQQQSLKCGCEKYFPSPLFKNKCSMCFQKEFPEGSRRGGTFNKSDKIENLTIKN